MSGQLLVREQGRDFFSALFVLPARRHNLTSGATPGTYTVWLRGYTPNAAGDSLYVTLDNQPVATFTGFTPGEWSWTNRDASGGVVTIAVTEPGLHTLHLWQREDGLRLDRILLTTDNNYNPSGNGPPESEIR